MNYTLNHVVRLATHLPLGLQEELTLADLKSVATLVEEAQGAAPGWSISSELKRRALEHRAARAEKYDRDVTFGITLASQYGAGNAHNHIH